MESNLKDYLRKNQMYISIKINQIVVNLMIVFIWSMDNNKTKMSKPKSLTKIKIKIIRITNMMDPIRQMMKIKNKKLIRQKTLSQISQEK